MLIFTDSETVSYWDHWVSFPGGISDGIICSAPGIRKGKDLLKVPYELFGACSLRTAPMQLAGSPQQEQRGSPRHGHHGELGDSGRAGCEPKAKARPASLRHAIATVVITGVLCGIVCLMMLAAAVYGCAYAAITAKYRKEHLGPARQHGTAKEKEPLESSSAWAASVFGFLKIKPSLQLKSLESQWHCFNRNHWSYFIFFYFYFFFFILFKNVNIFIVRNIH